MLWILFVSLIGVLVFVHIFGEYSARISAFEIKLSSKFSTRPATNVNIPPIGRITAITHKTPLQINITLTNVNLDVIKDILLSSPDKLAIFNDIKNEAGKIIKIYILKLLFLSFLGAVFAAYAANLKAIKYVFFYGLIGLLFMAAMVSLTYYTYDYNAFSNPEYTGILKAAPWMMGLAEEALSKVNELGDRMEIMAENIYTLFEKIDELKPLGLNEKERIKVLHVSDIHNNPVAMDFIEDIVESFKADIIIDTGDITDFGTPLEAELLTRIEKLKIPYIFIPGNHDSPIITEKMKTLKNVVVLKEDLVKVKGLKIFGVQDPSADYNDIKPPDGFILDTFTENIINTMENINTPIDIAATHNPVIAKKIFKNKKVVLFGHTHSFGIENIDGSVFVNAGTSGAAGIRGLQTQKEIPYSVVLLYFDINESPKLVAADIIKVYNLKRGLTLERVLID
ncbi:MAG: hypothetical protein PWQ82_500 [Thermosediminibacterales bacterium]|nr:hypothetical protein [Thermosediminibacterales bacterium]